MNPLTWLRAVARDEYRPEPMRATIKALLPALTGQDTRILLAIDACWQAYGYSDEVGQRGVLEAVRALLPGMQEKCRPLARELIARALEWSDRDRLWPRVAAPCRTVEEDLREALEDAATSLETAARWGLRKDLDTGLEGLRPWAHNRAQVARRALRDAGETPAGADDPDFAPLKKALAKQAGTLEALQPPTK